MKINQPTLFKRLLPASNGFVQRRERTGDKLRARGASCPRQRLATFLVVGIILAIGPARVLLSSDFYLPRGGPPPLRFAAVPSKKDFVWPVGPKVPNPATNSAEPATVSGSAPRTNNAVVMTAASGLPEPQTNALAGWESYGFGPLITTSIPNGYDANSFSASNLLFVTPQMLADYFKANLDGNNKPLTNSTSGADVPFTPPTPKTAPSSEAVYRTE